jgi:hypothetical protein
MPFNGREKKSSILFIGADAFPSIENLIKAYPGQHSKASKERIFNYGICRARRVVENVVGFASSVVRVLRKPMLLEPETAQLFVVTFACLHNFLRRNLDWAAIYTPPGTFDCEENVRTAMSNENMTPLFHIKLQVSHL